MKKIELLRTLRKMKACEAAIKFVKSCADFEEVKKKASGVWIAWLLIRRPEFAEHADWTKLNGDDWRWLLERRPEFEKYRKGERK